MAIKLVSLKFEFWGSWKYWKVWKR